MAANGDFQAGSDIDWQVKKKIIIITFLTIMVSLKVRTRRQSKKLQIQGAQILRNEAYLLYVAVTKNAAQRSPAAAGFTKPSTMI